MYTRDVRHRYINHGYTIRLTETNLFIHIYYYYCTSVMMSTSHNSTHYKTRIPRVGTYTYHNNQQFSIIPHKLRETGANEIIQFLRRLYNTLDYILLFVFLV